MPLKKAIKVDLLPGYNMIIQEERAAGVEKLNNLKSPLPILNVLV